MDQLSVFVIIVIVAVIALQWQIMRQEKCLKEIINAANTNAAILYGVQTTLYSVCQMMLRENGEDSESSASNTFADILKKMQSNEVPYAGQNEEDL